MALESATALAQREQELAGLKTQVPARLNHGIQTPRTGIPGRPGLLLETPLEGQETASQLQALVANSRSWRDAQKGLGKSGGFLRNAPDR
jgi:hypothetical protein